MLFRSSNCYRNAKGEVIQVNDALEQDYIDHNMPVVDAQLTKAGLRLAKMLNAVYDPDAKDLPAPHVKPATAPATKAPGATPKKADPSVKGEVMFVGSRNSEVYHYPGCSDCKKILPKNLVEYTTAPEGKRLHSGCPTQVPLLVRSCAQGTFGTVHPCQCMSQN